ncbi:hypothetical protein ACTXT7_011501 [Hymenolepis weldensis]
MTHELRRNSSILVIPPLSRYLRSDTIILLPLPPFPHSFTTNCLIHIRPTQEMLLQPANLRKMSDSLSEDRERALLELYIPDATHTSVEESEVVAEIIQYYHDPESTIFNSTVNVVTREKAKG